MLLLRNAGVSFPVVVITSLKICYTRVIQVAMSAVGEDVLNEKLLRLKNSRSGYLSTVTARLNEIDALLSKEENIDLVKEKLADFTAAFEAFKEAHIFFTYRTFKTRLASRGAKNLLIVRLYEGTTFPGGSKNGS